MTRKVIAAYIPVLHQGYRTLFENNPSFHELYIVDDSILNTFREIVKDIRRLDPVIIRQSLTAWNLFYSIVVADENVLATLNHPDTTVLMPELCRYLRH